MSNYDYDDYYDTERRFVPRLVVSKFVHPISQPDTIEKYLNQTKVWMDHEGTEHKIKDMDKEYIFNILSWARKNYDRLDFTYNFLEEVSISVLDLPLFDKLRTRYKKLVA